VPTYSYRCASCQHAFDQYQGFTDASLTVCPACNEPMLRKVFNSIGVTFNGSGFYRTDSRSEAGASKSSSTTSTTSTSASAPAVAPSTASPTT
jgi:putative FmdB family regulatory protein